MDRQPRKIDVRAPPDDLLAGGPRNRPRAQAEGGPQHVALRPGAPEIARRARCPQLRQPLPQPYKIVCIQAHAQGNAFGGAEEIDQHGHGRGRAIDHDGPFEQQCRTVGFQYAPVDFGDLVLHRDRMVDPAQQTASLQKGGKL
ncbi:hypothetical protein D3C86_1688030 [compost metagenome]